MSSTPTPSSMTKHRLSMRELDFLIRSHQALIHICTHEERRVIETLEFICRRDVKNVWCLYTWDLAAGLACHSAGVKMDPTKAHMSQIQVLNWFANLAPNPKFAYQVLVLKDFHSFLGRDGSRCQVELETVRLLRNLTHANMSQAKCVVTMGADMNLPSELSKLCGVIDWPLPEREHIQTKIDSLLKYASERSDLAAQFRTTYSEAEMDEIVRAFQGLTIDEVEQICFYMMITSPYLDAEKIASKKRDVIRKSGVLEWVEVTADLSAVGGLYELKRWLNHRTDAFGQEAVAYGLPACGPKGVMFVGVQGAGKTLSANAVASHWKLPMLRLDIGKVYHGIVGASEQNMRSALKIAESVAPCILMIDEIDKGLSGTGSSNVSDGGTTSRVFGTILTWMQDKTCFDEQTEILTDQGWKRIADLNQTELVATRSPLGIFEWEKPIRYIQADYDGPMVRFHTKTTDIFVTPDHQMLVQRCHGTRREHERMVQAQSIVNKGYAFRVPAKSIWNGEEKSSFTLPAATYMRGGTSIERRAVNIPMDVWLAFLGIYLSEGWTCSGQLKGTSNRYYRVGIAQTKPGIKAEIAEMLEKTPFKWRYEGGSFVCNDLRLFRYCSQFGKCDGKYIAREFLELSARQLSILWEWLLKGDGNEFTQANGSRQITYKTTSPRLAGDVQELFQKIGFDGSISEVRARLGGSIDGRIISGKKTSYVVTLRTARNRALWGEWSHYTGKVYCVTVPNGVVYTRRNGKPAWCGNCPVFVVATANDVSNLPPELLRKGRFDEIFYVDLPDPKERQEIFMIHLDALAQRNPELGVAEINVAELVEESAEMTGAEIKAAIESALYEAFYDDRRSLETDDIINAITETEPLAHTMREKIERLREWAKNRARNASVPKKRRERARRVAVSPLSQKPLQEVEDEDI